METGALRSTILKRLLFLLYVFGILVIAATAPTQRVAMSPAVLEPAISGPGINETDIAEPVMTGGPDPASAVTPDANTVKMAMVKSQAASPAAAPAVIPSPAAALNVPVSAPVIPAPAPAPRTSVSLPADLKPLGSPFLYKDNNRKQMVSVAVEGFTVVPEYSYLYEDLNSPDVVDVYARPGYKFLLVGVTWELVKVVGEGTRTTFVTPTTASYTLVHGRNVYQAVSPSALENALNYYIINQGCLVRDRSIDKDTPGSGILIFEIPDQVRVGETYLDFCPRNRAGLKNEPRSPDTWDCAKGSVRWSLVPPENMTGSF